MNTFLGLFGIAAALLFGTSVGVMSMSPPEYDVARGTAIGASVSAIITYLLWVLTTDEHLPTKVLVGMAAGIVTLGVLPIGLHWISRIQDRNLQLIKSPTQKDTRLAMARQWIRLADEINADLPALRQTLEPNSIPLGMTPEQRQQLWNQQTDKLQRAFNTMMDSMRLKYRGRIAAARDEMVKNEIPLQKHDPSDAFLTDPTLMLVNQFSFMQWANKLNIEGRGVLALYGVSE